MDFILRLIYLVLAFNAVIVLIMVFYYVKVGRHQKITVDFEGYIASLPKNASICDPYIFVDGKWVKTDKACQNPSPKI
jgi:hypothetical protein